MAFVAKFRVSGTRENRARKTERRDAFAEQPEKLPNSLSALDDRDTVQRFHLAARRELEDRFPLRSYLPRRLRVSCRLIGEGSRASTGLKRFAAHGEAAG